MKRKQKKKLLSALKEKKQNACTQCKFPHIGGNEPSVSKSPRGQPSS